MKHQTTDCLATHHQQTNDHQPPTHQTLLASQATHQSTNH